MAWFTDMKRVTEKSSCTGCGACANVCAGGFIFMKSDISGFLYPTIDTGRCIGCGKCRQICPKNIERSQNGNKSSECGPGSIKDKNVYLGVHAPDKTIRMESSSGGAFSVFAGEILSRGGAVCAAALCEDMVVRHLVIKRPEDLPKLRKTKYVQSDTGMVFREIRDILKGTEKGNTGAVMGIEAGNSDAVTETEAGNRKDAIKETENVNFGEVLFVGTPCQCMGLKSFLGKEYSSLYTAALVCYGVPSPKVFSNYVKFLGKQKGGKVTSFSFRDKRNHDSGHTVSYTVCPESKNKKPENLKSSEKEYFHPLNEDAYSKLYFRNHIIRPSCFSCPYANPDRETDITLGDFWGIEKVKKEFDDGDGTSLVILHSEKSRRLWESVKSKTEYFECQREDVLQPRLRGPVDNPKPYPAMGLLVKGPVFRKFKK